VEHIVSPVFILGNNAKRMVLFADEQQIARYLASLDPPE